MDMDSSRAYWEQRHALSGPPLLPPSPLAQQAFRWLHDRFDTRRFRPTVADLGAAGSTDAELLAAVGSPVVAVDFSLPGLQHVRPPVIPVLADLRRPLPFREGTFDFILSHLTANCSFTTEEILRLFREIHRILVPAGAAWLLVRSTSDPTYCKLPQRGPGLYRLAGTELHFFSKKYLRRLLAGVGEAEIEPMGLQRDGERYNGLVVRMTKGAK